MISPLTLVGIAVAAYLLSFPFYLLRNIYYARRCGAPYVIVPLDQNALPWMVFSVPIRHWLRRHLPKSLYLRIAVTIYGWEFHELDDPYDKWAKPAGDAKTLVLATFGGFEINSMDGEFAMEVLRRPRDFPEPFFNQLFVGRFGQNILTSNGDQWARHRKIIAPVINERVSKVVFGETVSQVRGLLQNVLGDGKLNKAETSGMFDMMKKITVHVLSGASMGQSVSWDHADDKPRPGYKMTYMQSAKKILDGMSGPIILPMWFFNGYPSFLPGWSFLRSLGVAVREYPAHTRDMLKQERIRQAEEPGETKHNIVSQLLQAAEQDKTGISLSEDEMVGNLFIFTVAGFDTTANTLSYALASLIQYPEIQNWMLEEIDEIAPADGDELDYQADYPKATRVMAVMLETLRMYPPLVHIPKCTDTPQVVTTSKHTYHLPRKTIIYLNSVGMHRNPEVWRNLNMSKDELAAISPTSTPDEHVFRPKRWILHTPEGESLFQPPRGSYMPWSAGPRNCPGQKMAQVEFTAAFLALFSRHRVDAVPLQIPVKGGAGLGMREETADEVATRVAARMRDSLSMATLQMNNVYDLGPDAASAGLKIRLSRR